MTVNHNNIDQWLFDYFEGNLSPAQIKQLQGFIKANPEYKEDFDAWKNSFVEESVPAFDSSFLIKDVTPAEKRNKRLAVAALALLLIGGSTFYFTRDNNGFNDENITALSSGSGKSVNKVLSESNSAKAKASNLSLFEVKGEANKYSSTDLANEQSNETVLAQQNNLTSVANNRNFGRTNTTRTTTVISNPNDQLINVETNSLLTNQSSALTNNTFEASVFAPEFGEELAINSFIKAEKQNKKNKSTETTTNEDISGPLSVNEGHPHALNPDLLLKKRQETASNNKLKANEYGQAKKHEISPEKGIQFNNLKNVTLLQPVNFEIENNASFLIQHYPVDMYMGYNNVYTTATKENISSMTAGVSQYFRKIKMVFDVNGGIEKSNFYSKTSASVSAAYNIRFDRYQNLVPSLSFTYDQINFEPFNNYPTFAPIDPSQISSFGLERLTGSSNMREYSSLNMYNLRAGLLYHHKRFYTGLSANGLLFPHFKYTDMDRSLSSVKYPSVNFIAGTDFISKQRPELSFSPQISVNFRNLDPTMFIGGSTKYRGFVAGGSVGTNGSLNAILGISKKNFGIQYRFMFDKTDELYGNIVSNNISAHLNLKGLMKKQKAILDSEK